MTDTIKAINTGQLATRSGADLSEHTARGKSQLEDRQLRHEMDEIVSRLEKVRALVRKTIDDPGERAESANQIDAERDEIVQILNTAAARFKLQGLPRPTSVTEWTEVYSE